MEILIVGILNIICFIVGAVVGQKVRNNEKIEFNPRASIKNYEDRKEQERIQARLNTMLQNIDSYDGSSTGQIDV